ncbi:MFS general substrate transporter [Astrocystis sublimbata]|nr:MFS general substrate transporter [Astrocystis sublimbata]
MPYSHEITEDTMDVERDVSQAQNDRDTVLFNASALDTITEHSREADGSLKATTNGNPIDSIDPSAERRLRWKIDLHIYPILFVLYIFAYLDRINIGNARIQGLTEDLNLYGNRYNIALFVYFIPYIILETPSNMIIKKVRPSWYLSALMFGWGIVNMSMGFVKTFGQLVALRFLLGMFEAGFLPGMIYLTSMYYKRHDFQLRMSIIFFGIVISGAIGGLLAYAIAGLDGQFHMRAWRWIFIIEGGATALLSIFAVFLIADWPSECRFLDAQEKVLLSRIIAADSTAEARMDTLNKQAYKLIFSDWKIWVCSLANFGLGGAPMSITFFIPTILAEFGWTARQAQIHSVPIFVAAAFWMLFISWLSDRSRHRYGFIMFGFVVTIVGFSLLLCQDKLSRDVKYAALFLIAIGGFPQIPFTLTWLANNISGHWKRAFSSSMEVALGNISGPVMTSVYLEREALRYPTGYGTALALTLLGGIAATVMFVGLLLENRARDAGKRDHRLHRPAEEVENMGDHHPSFRFTL